MKSKEELLRTVLKRGLKPIEKLTVSEWARDYRVISSGNAEPGRWKNSRTPYLKEVMDSFTNSDVHRIVLKSSAQIGKALWIETPMATSEGWKRMGDLKIGDEVFDENGRICKIIGVSEIFRDHDCYRMRFSDGSRMIADGDHRWLVTDNASSSEKILTTREIFTSCNTGNLKDRYSISVSRELQEVLSKPTSINIVDVRKTETVPTKCISVNSESHLYLAGESMIATHNSECINNVIGRFVHLDPCPIMIVQPTIEMSQDYSKRRLAPMIRDCSVLSKLFYDDRGASKSRDANQTILSKFFPGGSLVLAGANSPAGLASRPIRIVLFDEVDRFPLSAASEGDPVDIASKRTATFWNYKIGLFSTPTLENESRIEEAYLSGTQEVWSHVCPRCGCLQPIEFEDIFEEEGKIYWKCPSCSNKFPEIVIKNTPAMYIAKNPDVKSMTRSFFVNAFSSPWVEWRDVLREYEQAKGNPEREQVVVNTRLGKTYKPHVEIKEIKDLIDRREEYGSELPEGVLILTAAVDVQDTRLEYEICGWGIDEERWGVKYGTIIGKPSAPKVWELLDEILEKEYKFSDGKTLRVYRTFIDSGGHFTSSVYDYVKPRQLRGRFAIKGVGRSGIPLLDKTLKHGDLYLTSLGVNDGKSQVYSRLQTTKIGAQFMHFPTEDKFKRHYDEKYFSGLMSEHLVEHISGGRKYMTFEPLSKHTRNEPLDLAVYNLACLKSLRITHEKWLELSGSPSIEVKQKPKSKKIQTRSIE